MKHNLSLFKSYVTNLQATLSALLLEQDPTICLTEDNWQRAEGGGGKTLAFSNGNIIEKAGVNFSHVWGNQLPSIAAANRLGLSNGYYQALGISIIIHPLNPYAPTCHANLRLFSTNTEQGDPIWWFGGGFDLTPYYGFEEDCVHWHTMAKKACDLFDREAYPKYKKWADEYFFIKHRNEPRGIGGLFFDDLCQCDFATCLDFVQNVGNHFILAYFPILERRKQLPFGEEERNFQCYRRGRYVEFNLLYDRGTLFGLQSTGRIESILISLPPLVSWRYNWQPTFGSKEAELYEKYLQPREWV